MVRKDQIDATGVDVDRRAIEQTQRHGRALDVPAGTARARAVIPRSARPVGRLPQHEVTRIVF
jgi:hypothetical protein